jgi:zinc and cadmium transporter
MMLVIIYGLLIFFTSLAGGLAPLILPNANESRLKLFVCLGAGLLLGMSLLHMIPEASELIPKTFGIWFLVGFLLLLVLERFVMVHACEEHGCHYHTVGLAAFAGLTIHGIIEGIALASSLVINGLGPLVLVAILSHKAPGSFTLTSILKLAGKSTKQIVLFVIGVSLSGPLGLLLAHLFLDAKDLGKPAGILLAVSAGRFLFISTCDLLPELHKTDTERGRRLTAFFVGIALSFLSGYFVG